MPKIRWHFFPDRVYYAERASLHPNQTSAYRRVNLRVASINHRQVHCTSVQPNTSCTALLVQLPFTVPMSLSRAFGQYAPTEKWCSQLAEMTKKTSKLFKALIAWANNHVWATTESEENHPAPMWRFSDSADVYKCHDDLQNYCAASKQFVLTMSLNAVNDNLPFSVTTAFLEALNSLR